MVSRKAKAKSTKTKTSVAGRTEPGKAKVTSSRNKPSRIETQQPGTAGAGGLSELRALLAKLDANKNDELRAFAIVLKGHLDAQERDFRLVGKALAHSPRGGVADALMPPLLTDMEGRTDSLVRTALILGGLKDASSELKRLQKKLMQRARDEREKQLNSNPAEMAFRLSVDKHATAEPHDNPHKYAESIRAQVNADLTSANFAEVTVEKVRRRVKKIGALSERRRK